jgi:hypothetical protein
MENVTEYEWLRGIAEGDAVKQGAVNDANIPRMRTSAQMILKRIGLTPERVWELTRGMRDAGTNHNQ